jgi:membrane protease YdiL (CAAX protease family)
MKASSLSVPQPVGAWDKLIALAGAAMVTVAVGGYWWPLLPQAPTALRWAVHGIVAPLLGVFVLRRALPDMRFSRAHAPLAILALGYIGAVTLIAGRFGFERTYSDLRVAVALAVLAGLAVWATLSVRTQRSTEPGISGWWQVVLAVIVATSCAKAWDSGTSVAGELVFEFVLVGMTEEFAFRGVIQGWLGDAWPGRWLGLSSANWVTALLFAWYHNPQFATAHLPWFLYLLPMGLLFGGLRDRTGSWLLPGVAHGLISPLLYSWSLLGVVRLPGS